MEDVKTVKFGEHIIFDGYGCDPEKLNNMEHCVDVMNKLADLSGLHKMIEPILIKAVSNEALGGKDPGGFSGFTIIQESHISLHTFVKRGFVTIDLYSCKPFNTEGIVEYIREAFGVKDENVLKLERGMKYPSENIY